MITLAENNPNREKNEAASSPVGFKNIPAFEKPIELEIHGKIPSWINGVMYRSGTYNYSKAR